MRIANLAGRLVILTADSAIDVQRASEGRFSAEPQAIYERWAEFTAWSAAVGLRGGERFDQASLGAPAAAPDRYSGSG